MRARVRDARVGRLATVTADGAPHMVPVCFALLDASIVTAVDNKPKRSSSLKRVANIVANGRASLLVDEYTEDWDRLWWIRVDGLGRVVDDSNARAAALDELMAKYQQYARRPPPGPVIELTELRWSAWGDHQA